MSERGREEGGEGRYISEWEGREEGRSSGRRGREVHRRVGGGERRGGAVEGEGRYIGE